MGKRSVQETAATAGSVKGTAATVAASLDAGIVDTGAIAGIVDTGAIAGIVKHKRRRRRRRRSTRRTRSTRSTRRDIGTVQVPTGTPVAAKVAIDQTSEAIIAATQAAIGTKGNAMMTTTGTTKM